MADDFDLVGRVRIDTTDLGNVSSSIGASFKGMAAAAAGALAAAGVADLLRDSIAEARDAVKVTALTENVIKSTGGAAKITAGQVGDLAESLSNYAGIDDEVIQGGENLLLTFKGVRNEVGKGNDIFNQTSKLAVDMATALNMDVNSAFMSLGKALDNPAAGLAKLTKQGVTFTDQQKDQVKALVESGKTMEAQKIILGELASQVGGAAGAAADPFQRFQVVIGNLKESIGTALLPVFNELIGFMAEKLPAAVDFAQGVFATLAEGFEGGMAGTTRTGDGLIDTLHVIGGVARNVVDTVKRVISIVTALIQGDIAGAGVDIGLLFGNEEDSKATGNIIKTIETIRDVIGKVVAFTQENLPKIVEAFKTVASFIGQNVLPILGAVAAVLASTGTLSLVAAISAAAASIGAFITTAGGPLAAVIAALGGPITLAIAGIAALVAGVIYAYQHFEGFREVVDKVIAFIQEQFSHLVAFAQEIFPQLQEAVGHVFSVIQTIVETVLAVIVGAWHLFGDDIIKIAGGVFQIVKSIVETVINTIANIIRFVLAVINGDWGKAWQALKDIVSGIFDGIKGVVSGALTVIVGYVGGIYDGLKHAASAAFGAITDAIQGVVGSMFDIGKNIIQGIIDGIRAMAGKLIDAIKKNVTDALPGFAKDALGIHSPSAVFRDIFRHVPEGAALGIADGASDVVNAMKGLTTVPALTGGGFGASAAGALGTSVAIEINFNGGANESDVRGVIPELTDALRAAVGAR